MLKRFTIAAMAALLLVVSAAPALAYSSKTVDAPAFPDTCNITGTNYYSGWYRATTTEQSNCARIEAELRYKDNNGVWQFKQTNYLYQSSVATNWYSGQNGDYTDHNGDNNSSDPAYGYRIETPGA